MIGKTIGQYQIIDKIGEGGMGVVYKAEDTTLHRIVALKMLSGHLTEDEEARARFVREAQSASSLNHPNITTVYEFLEDEDTRLICMEYVEGKTIRDMVESGIVSIKKAIDIIIQAADALEAAHNKGILHRDVKSANIMVNMEGRVKVMDFGLAHLEERSKLTRTGTSMGTLSYSSPEQISGKRVNRQSEIFSLGVVFYELLTGQLPFKASNEAEIVFAIINNEPPKLSKVRDDVPELVEVIAARMLEKDPELRFQSCDELIRDLKGIQRELETSTVHITTTRYSVSRRLWIVAKRAFQNLSILQRAGLFALGTAVIIALTIIVFRTPDILGPQASSTAMSPASGDAAGEYSASIAVLPFDNLSGETADDYISQGIARAIWSQLAGISQLKVTSWTSAVAIKDTGLRLPQIADTLGVQHVLEGTIQKSGNQIRVNVHLSDAENDNLVWSQQYEGNLSDLFSLQDKIAIQVSTGLIEQVPTLMGSGISSQTGTVDAYLAYLRGSEHLHRRTSEGISKSIEAFHDALRLSPGYAPAYSGLSTAHMLNVSYGYPSTLDPYLELSTALTYAEKAISLSPENAEAHASRAYILIKAGADERDIRPSVEKALQIKPNVADFHGWFAHQLARDGFAEEAIAEHEIAIALDPLAPGRHIGYAWDALILHRFDLTLREANRAEAIETGITRKTHQLRAHALLYQGQPQNALLLDLSEHLPLKAICLRDLGQQAQASALIDSIVTVLSQAADVQRHHRYAVQCADLAIYFGWFNEIRESLRWIEEAISISPNILQYRVLFFPQAEHLRSNLQYQRGIERFKAEIYSRFQREYNRVKLGNPQ